ncbi:hypothetical protein AVEN_17126-1, partial [Araneus ventricosus]
GDEDSVDRLRNDDPGRGPGPQVRHEGGVLVQGREEEGPDRVAAGVEEEECLLQLGRQGRHADGAPEGMLKGRPVPKAAQLAIADLHVRIQKAVWK